VSPYRTPDVERAYKREWVARRRAEWMAAKTCSRCGSDRSLSVHHESVSMKSIWTRRDSYRLPLLAEAFVLCRRCRMAPTEALEWCEALGVWCDGERRTVGFLRAVEGRLAA